MKRIIDSYCQVILSGLNVRPGQCLNISAEPCHIPVLRTLVAHAYKMGVKYVEVQIDSNALLRERLLNSSEQFLSYAPGTTAAKQDVFIKENWARLAVSSPDDPNVFHDTSQERLVTAQTAMRKAQEKYKQAVMIDTFNWNVCAIPTEKWAAKVLKQPAGPRAERNLWRLLVPIYRLDRPDPVAAWKEHCSVLSRRANALTSHGIKSLRFLSSHTDLTVGLHRDALWKGGYSVSSEGVQFIPNLPTEEVFTTPDFRATEGRVRLTRPSIIFEKEVIGAELTFAGGKVTRLSARKNEEILRGLISIDAGAARLGEIALVDSASPLFQSKKIFYNILFDENASCHFAFGGAYPSCLRGGVEMDAATREKHGVNQSIVHNDVMIGSEDMEVIAVTYAGDRLRIIKDGVFCDIS